jgi:valyl-tRNA synthetase
VITNSITAIIYFEKEETEEDKALKQKEIESLRNSIKRRESLLANENYCNKAPHELVEKERLTLEAEIEKLKMMEE